jgi:hypothetical protein
LVIKKALPPFGSRAAESGFGLLSVALLGTRPNDHRCERTQGRGFGDTSGDGTREHNGSVADREMQGAAQVHRSAVILSKAMLASIVGLDPERTVGGRAFAVIAMVETRGGENLPPSS